MICNELNRAQNNIDYPEEYSNCLERALELCDFCSNDDLWKNRRLYELRRARYVLSEMYHSKQLTGTHSISNAILMLDPESWGKLNV